MRRETALGQFEQKDSHAAKLCMSIKGFCDFGSLERPVMPRLLRHPRQSVRAIKNATTRRLVASQAHDAGQV